MQRAGPFESHLPHLSSSPVTTFLRGYLNDTVYRMPPNIVSELKVEINQAGVGIDGDTFEYSLQERGNRLCLVLKERCIHLQHLPD